MNNFVTKVYWNICIWYFLSNRTNKRVGRIMTSDNDRSISSHWSDQIQLIATCRLSPNIWVLTRLMPISLHCHSSSHALTHNGKMKEYWILSLLNYIHIESIKVILKMIHSTINSSLTMISKQSDNRATESWSRPEVTGHDSVQSDVKWSLPAVVSNNVLTRQWKQELRFDKLFPVVARSPFNSLIAGIEHQLIVLPVDDAIDYF